MGWLTHRVTIITISVISLLILFGLGSSVGIVVSGTEILNSGITWLHLMAIGQVYIAFMLWKRYI